MSSAIEMSKYYQEVDVVSMFITYIMYTQIIVLKCAWKISLTPHEDIYIYYIYIL